MSAVFVHGVPETARVWDGLRRHLHRTDTTALSLPGFGRPRPSGFSASMDDYADWVVAELEKVVKESGGPADLVGHDWGGGFVVRVVSTRADLVHSWVTDAAGLADVDFEWHDFAKIWQTPGDGEAFWDEQIAMPVADRAAVFTTFGVPDDGARTLAEPIDRVMADSILALYRSATKVHEEWGPAFEAIPKPGMVIVPTADAFLAEDQARRAAARAGASVQVLEDRGHWWMLENPAAGAALLEAFWATT